MRHLRDCPNPEPAEPAWLVSVTMQGEDIDGRPRYESFISRHAPTVTGEHPGNVALRLGIEAAGAQMPGWSYVCHSIVHEEDF